MFARWLNADQPWGRGGKRHRWPGKHEVLHVSADGSIGGCGKFTWQGGSPPTAGPPALPHRQTTCIKSVCSDPGGGGFGSGESHQGQMQTPERH